ncbi:hypothetical protein K040078D81_18380 [Blautia hominis]|uniref:Uncharacterized protein n=1 Tax=Blautia hominis TaxID=2025493 RepID=A0ABQ0B8E0_9FIRM
MAKTVESEAINIRDNKKAHCYFAEVERFIVNIVLKASGPYPMGTIEKSCQGWVNRA